MDHQHEKKTLNIRPLVYICEYFFLFCSLKKSLAFLEVSKGNECQSILGYFVPFFIVKEELFFSSSIVYYKENHFLINFLFEPQPQFFFLIN